MFSMSMEGAICPGTNQNDEQTSLITVHQVVHPSSGWKDLFFAPKYCKSTLGVYFFKLHLLAMCLIVMDSVGHPCHDQ